MKSTRWSFIILLVLLWSCKDSSQKHKDMTSTVEVEKPVTLTVQEQQVQEIEEFYKPVVNRKGDTLLPYIPQDSVEAFFTRYAAQHPETKVRMSTSYGDIEMELFEETPLYRASFLFLIKNLF